MSTKCNIVTDSCCDCTPAQAKDAHIEVLSFSYTEADKPDGGFHGVDDLFQTIDAHTFYDAIRRGAAPLTSQPSQLVYEESFERALASGVPTVYFCLSSGISGAFNGASVALKRFKELHKDEDVPIYVVDSLIGSTTQNLFIDQAVRKRDEGLSAEELVAWAEDARFHTHTIFTVENLNALHHGGRIPKSVALVGDAFDVKPLITWDLEGKLSINGVTRGRKKSMRRMVEFYERSHRDDEYGPVVAIGDADCPDDGYELASNIREAFPGVRVLRSTIGPTIGCHVGPGMLSCCFWGEDRREKGHEDTRKAKGVRQG